MANLTLKFFAAAAMSVAMPDLANAQVVSFNTSSPVTITSFSADEYAPGTIGGQEARVPQFIAAFNSGYITLTFSNHSNVPATTVKFLVNYGPHTHRIVDKGTFSPEVQIKHTFAVDSDLSTLINATCEVAEVDFADGSAWHIGDGDAGKR